MEVDTQRHILRNEHEVNPEAADEIKDSIAVTSAHMAGVDTPVKKVLGEEKPDGESKPAVTGPEDNKTAVTLPKQPRQVVFMYIIIAIRIIII